MVDMVIGTHLSAFFNLAGDITFSFLYCSLYVHVCSFQIARSWALIGIPRSQLYGVVCATCLHGADLGLVREVRLFVA